MLCGFDGLRGEGQAAERDAVYVNVAAGAGPVAVGYGPVFVGEKMGGSGCDGIIADLAVYFGGGSLG